MMVTRKSTHVSLSRLDRDKILNVNYLIDNDKNTEAKEVLQKLEFFEIDIADEDYEVTPLQMAVLKENLDMVAACLQKGFDPATKNRKGLNAYHYAARTNNVDVMNMLPKTNDKCYFCTVL